MLHEGHLILTSVTNDQLNCLEEISIRVSAIVDLADIKARLPLFVQDFTIIDPGATFNPVNVLHDGQLSFF